MDNKLNEIRRKISFLRSEMLRYEEAIRKQVNRDEDCSTVLDAANGHAGGDAQPDRGTKPARRGGAAARRGGTVEAGLPRGDPKTTEKATTEKTRNAIVSDEPLEWKIHTLRGQLVELGWPSASSINPASTVRQLSFCCPESGRNWKT